MHTKAEHTALGVWRLLQASFNFKVSSDALTNTVGVNMPVVGWQEKASTWFGKESSEVQG